VWLSVCKIHSGGKIAVVSTCVLVCVIRCASFDNYYVVHKMQSDTCTCLLENILDTLDAMSRQNCYGKLVRCCFQFEGWNQALFTGNWATNVLPQTNTTFQLNVSSDHSNGDIIANEAILDSHVWAHIWIICLYKIKWL